MAHVQRVHLPLLISRSSATVSTIERLKFGNQRVRSWRETDGLARAAQVAPKAVIPRSGMEWNGRAEPHNAVASTSAFFIRL